MDVWTVRPPYESQIKKLFGLYLKSRDRKFMEKARNIRRGAER